MPKIIKFGWDFTKLYQFNIKQMEMCSFFGPPCIWLQCEMFFVYVSVREFYDILMNCVHFSVELLLSNVLVILWVLLFGIVSFETRHIAYLRFTPWYRRQLLPKAVVTDWWAPPGLFSVNGSLTMTVINRNWMFYSLCRASLHSKLCLSQQYKPCMSVCHTIEQYTGDYYLTVVEVGLGV